MYAAGIVGAKDDRTCDTPRVRDSLPQQRCPPGQGDVTPGWELTVAGGVRWSKVAKPAGAARHSSTLRFAPEIRATLRPGRWRGRVPEDTMKLKPVMKQRHGLQLLLAHCCATAALLAPVAPAQAALVTLVGTNFDLTYDDSLLGIFSAPTLVGNSVFFSFNSFVAESLNGAGVVTRNSTASGLKLTAKNGFQFGAFSLAEFGDYKLNGPGSSVQVSGQLRAFNWDSPLNTQTSKSVVVSASTPLNVNDGQLHDWVATARIDNTTLPVAVPSIFGVATNVILSNPNHVGITIENQLTAYTEPGSSGFRQAFIEKKLGGVQMTVSPVPLPPSVALMGAGLGVVAWIVRRRRAD